MVDPLSSKNDLCERLRLDPDSAEGLRHPAHYWMRLCDEAADEIERLARDFARVEGMLYATEAEVERLTRELQGTKDELYSVDKAAKELGAERDRLRAALERLKLPEFDRQSSRFDRIEKILRGEVETKVVRTAERVPGPEDHPIAFCGACGAALEAVRPGKFQHVGRCPAVSEIGCTNE